MQTGTATVVVLGTGGTIAGLADTPDDARSYRSAALPVSALVEALGGDIAITVESEEVARIDSKDMDHATWRSIALRVEHHLARGDVRGVVVAHGTDTMEETAWFLDRVVAATKPVVLTGAMRPANAHDADGPRNLADAIGVAAGVARGSSRASSIPSGVVVAIGGRVHAARDVRKVHPSIVDAFSSGDRAAGARVVTNDRPSRVLRAADLPLDAERWPRVAIVTSGAGANGDDVRALVAAGFAGIVVAATGNGTLHAGLDAALAEARARGVALLRSTRCIGGSLEPAPAARTAGAQAIEATDLTPAKARVELIVRLLEAGAASRD